MRISNISPNNFSYNTCQKTDKNSSKTLPNQQYGSYSNPVIYKNNFLSFGTLCRFNDRRLSEETAFFRDLGTLDFSVETLKENFPNGASILDFACGDGQESLSLLALLGDDREKYDIKAYDISDTLIQKAKKGKYAVYEGYYDEFLLYGIPGASLKGRTLLAFHEIMREDETGTVDGRYHNGILPDELSCLDPLCCCVRDEFKDMIEFDTASIEDIDKLNPKKPVGAVFFRNAFYHLFRPKGGYGFGFKEMTGKEKAEKAKEIVDKIDSVLAPNGIFVMGDSPLEHVFKADETILESDRARFCDIYKNTNSSVLYVNNNDYVFKQSPIVKALRDKGYKRLNITKSSVGIDSDRFIPRKINIGTVWQKPDA